MRLVDRLGQLLLAGAHEEPGQGAQGAGGGQNQVVAGHPAAALPDRVPAHRQPATQGGKRPLPVTSLIAIHHH
jgi:hypothetical protein